MTLVPTAAVMPLTPFKAVVICVARLDLAAVIAAAAAVAAASSATWTTARNWAPVEAESESDVDVPIKDAWLAGFASVTATKLVPTPAVNATLATIHSLKESSKVAFAVSVDTVTPVIGKSTFIALEAAAGWTTMQGSVLSFPEPLITALPPFPAL